MKQLSGLDTSFLSIETDTTFGHICTLSVYRQPTGSIAPIDVFRGQLTARLGLLEPLRRRLVPVPFDLDRPWWIEDPAFDLDFHVRHVAVPAPGSDRQVADLVGAIIGRPLDRSRPLWEAYVIEGLVDDRWAVLLKVHHAAVDGIAGAELQRRLLEDTPSDELPELPPPPPGEAVPTEVDLLARTAWGLALRPQRLLAAQARLARETGSMLADHRQHLGRRTDGPVRSRPAVGFAMTPAPSTPFNRSITPHRSLAYASVPLADVLALKVAFGVTVNDVVLAACAGGLRRYLDARGALTDRPLVAGIPVSIRSGTESDLWTNRVSSVTSPLPTHLDDPTERVVFVAAAMAQAKTAFEAFPSDALLDFGEFVTPGLLAQGAAAMTRLRAGDRMPPAINLVISNVPGPRQPLYLGSARLERYIPVSTIGEGLGLNITVQSYDSNIEIGLVACRELVPDLWELLDLITNELQGLADAASIPRPLSPTEPSTEEPSPMPAPTTPTGLDPQAKVIIDLTARAIANGAQPMWEMPAPEARDTYRRMTQMMGPGEPVALVEDRTIPGPGGDLTIRIYRPDEGTRPALVFYHGGGFVIGDLDTHDRENRTLANLSGAVVVAVDYRLAPEHPFPAATDDAWAALVWVREHADELGIDAGRLAVGGDSAGGNLAAVTAQRARDEGIELALQVLIYPAVDITGTSYQRYASWAANEGLVLSRQVNDWFISAYLGGDHPATDPRLQPIDGDLTGLAPALVITAEFDPLRDEGRAYARRLVEAGVTTTHTDYAGQIHGFFNLSPAIAAARTAIDEVAAALRIHLGASPSE